MDVDESSELRAEHEGLTYLFCSEKCRQRFLRDHKEFGPVKTFVSPGANNFICFCTHGTPERQRNPLPDATDPVDQEMSRDIACLGNTAPTHLLQNFGQP
jgi:YHS domain-containing protein